jgi:ribosomal protein L12E/L44/L45/RPP1/RPP2
MLKYKTVNSYLLFLQIPDELTKNLLLRSGVKCEDERTIRLVSLAAGKFLDDLIDECCMIQANRSQATIKHQQNEGFPKDKKPVILTEDLGQALQSVSLVFSLSTFDERQIQANTIWYHANVQFLPCSMV